MRTFFEWIGAALFVTAIFAVFSATAVAVFAIGVPWALAMLLGVEP